MGSIVDAFAAAFRDLDGAGNPCDVAKADARALGSAIETFLSGYATGTDLAAEVALRAALRAAFDAIFAAGGSDFTIVDANGFVAMRVDAGGVSLPGGRVQLSPLSGESLVDGLGFVLRHDGDRFSVREIAERNSRAMALSALVRARINADTAAFAWDLLHVLGYGQSLMAAQECWPALTAAGDPDCLMIGQSVRGDYSHGLPYNPLGDTTLRTLVATVQSNDGGANYSAGTVAGLSPGDAALGESPMESAVIFCRRLLRLHEPKDSYRFLATNVAVPGNTIEALADTSNDFKRITQAIAAGRNAASANGWSYGVPAVLWAQGEANYTTGFGGSTDKATYKANLKAMVTQIAGAVAGQADPPILVTYQTGGGFTVDSTGLSIGMAQWEASREDPRIALCAPAYAVPDKGLHLDPNGSRWLGCYYGKVLFETVGLRRRWRPLEPIEVVQRGRQILVSFSVPHPPLQFRPVFVVNALKDYAGKGFTVTNVGATQRFPITNAEIVSDTGVLLTLDRVPDEPALVWYGRADDAEGGGNLCDSDPLTAPFAYAYAAGTGQYASANIAAFVGKPYPLLNWCVQFVLPANPA